MIYIEEFALLDLMQAQALQRLHGALQHGITALIGITQPVTRFDHSMGVTLLVQRLGGSSVGRVIPERVQGIHGQQGAQHPLHTFGSLGSKYHFTFNPPAHAAGR